ncbi:hypothetical protein [Fusobacterium gonidiaformans]|mgnify:FL=1|uniref:hypothetical protein n=1 Tax=Fusobacterium gonidiaformans TaxID=849 RepID=UPI0001BC678E|nr:hypothetical protein [Fusobacterium gonidiaformans]AVQ16309.1 hypothetical protein C4N16_01645 [Fusobacterium gonidiaformans ATCC 25563]EFS28878.1 hypothetical protein FGAG_01199 [Fusobacterium gonidiaformans ATCC 25563]
MLRARLKQAYVYFFIPWTTKKEQEVQNFLSEEEFFIFSTMGRYDKNHSYFLWRKVIKSELRYLEIYQKLALLHDCGKEKKGFLARCLTVILGRKRMKDFHSERAYEKLKNRNLELAELCQKHHQRATTKEMELFQKLDDE